MLLSKKTLMEVDLPTKDCREITMKYIQIEILGGEGRYVTDDKKLEHWSSYPHGSGTTIEIGRATPLQITAWAFYLQLKEAQ